MSIEVYANKFLEKVVKSYGFLKPFSLFQALYLQYKSEGIVLGFNVIKSIHI